MKFSENVSHWLRFLVKIFYVYCTFISTLNTKCFTIILNFDKVMTYNIARYHPVTYYVSPKTRKISD